MTDATQGEGGAPPANNGAAAAVLNSPPPAPAFYESFQDAETKAWAEKGGFKSPEDVAALARKFDPFKDVDPSSLTVKPKDGDPNAFVAFAREHLGAPTEAAAYGLDAIEGVDKDLAGVAAGWFQEAGLTPFQAQHVAAKQMEHDKAQAAAMVKEEQASSERELTQLKTELGEAGYKETTEMGRRALKAAAQHAGVDANEFISYIESGAGTAAALKMAAFFGKFIKEGDFIDGGTGNPEPNDIARRWYPNT